MINIFNLVKISSSIQAVDIGFKRMEQMPSFGLGMNFLKYNKYFHLILSFAGVYRAGKTKETSNHLEKKQLIPKHNNQLKQKINNVVFNFFFLDSH